MRDPDAIRNAVCSSRVLAFGALVVVASLASPVTLGCSESGSELAKPKVDAGATGAVQGEIYLAALGVTTTAPLDASQPVGLVPPFSPTIHDYYVRCAPGSNPLTITMSAAPGAESVVLQPIAGTPSPRQTVSLTVQEGVAIVVAATLGSASNEYWVRCLPGDFPEMVFERHPEAGTPTPGYYLLGTEQASKEGVGYAMVLDANGVPVWYYRATTGVFDVDDVASPAISFMEYHPPGPSSFGLHDLSPLGTTTLSPVGEIADPHELRALKNGHFLMLSDTVQSGVDLTGYKVTLPGGRTEEFGPNSQIIPCDVLEVDVSGAVVSRWVGTDHFDPVKDCTYPQLGPASGVLDPFHCNSIDVDPEDEDLILVSGRNMDSVFMIDRSTGAVIWKLGGDSYCKDPIQFIDFPDKVGGPFHRQHDARLLPGWSTACSGKGQISVFDDETATSEKARAVVYDVTVAGSGTAGCGAPGATVAWQYSEGSTSSEYMGSFRILPDESRTICWGFGGALDGRVFTEVDVQGHDLLDFYLPDGSSYRTVKVGPGALDLGVLHATAGVACDAAVCAP